MTSKHETRGRPRRREFVAFCDNATEALGSNKKEVSIGARFTGHDSFRYSAPYRDLRDAFPAYKISLFSTGMNLTLSAVKI